MKKAKVTWTTENGEVKTGIFNTGNQLAYAIDIINDKDGEVQNIEILA